MMGEALQLHVAIPTYVTHPMSLYEAKQEIDSIDPSFPAGVQQGLLSLLVLVVFYNFPMATKENGH